MGWGVRLVKQLGWWGEKRCGDEGDAVGYKEEAKVPRKRAVPT